MIKPGEKATITFTFENTASALIKDVTTKLDLLDVPFSPESSIETIIDNIEGDGQETTRIVVNTLSDAESDLYKIPVEITYYDEFGTLYTKTDLVSLRIGASPDLSVVVESNAIIGQNNEIMVKFVNKGLGRVRFLDVRLQKSNSYEILSNDHIYLGDVDSDDFETAEFTIFLKENTRLPIMVTYSDQNNNEYEERLDLNMNIYTHEEAKQFGIIETGNTAIVIIVIAVLIVAFYLYRRRKKRRKR